MDYKQEYKRWLENADKETVAELNEISGNEKEIEERFYKTLEFGTAGLRGIIGAGPNRMNSYVVGQATQGLANQLIKTNPKDAELSVAIAYDSRIKSDEFAKTSAAILAANGIKVYLFEELKPVPELCRMGAKISVDGRVAVVCGTERLSGTEVNASDLRGGAALVIAALMADGTTVINTPEFIDRGYENFEANLAQLGADIIRYR